MKKNILLNGLLLLLLCSSMASCQAIGDIFKAGVWTGVLLVIGVIALIIYIIAKLSGKK